MLDAGVSLIDEGDEEVCHQEDDGGTEKENKPGSQNWMVQCECVVDGRGSDEVLVDCHVAEFQRVKIMARMAEQVGGQQGEGHASHHREVKQSHGCFDHANKHAHSPDLAVVRMRWHDKGGGTEIRHNSSGMIKITTEPINLHSKTVF